MLRNKLIVAGCSFSDFTKIDVPYGVTVAQKLGRNYVHEGAGCGSNQRIWRRITGMVLDGSITDQDLVVVQYTERTRQEFWTSYSQDSAYKGPNCKKNIKAVEDYRDGGHLIRFKYGAAEWQNNVEDKELFRLYEKGFISIEYATELFRVNNYNFQTMLARNNINCVFIKTWRYPYNLDTEILPEFESIVFYDSDIKEHHNLENKDYAHMNQEGHDFFADKLYIHIKDKVGL